MLVANAFMLGAFGNSAGLLLFSGSVALKTLHSSIVFSVALTSRAGGVVINSRILGHNESPFLELCYTLLLAPQCQVHKRQFQPGYPQRQHTAQTLARPSDSARIPTASSRPSRFIRPGLPLRLSAHVPPAAACTFATAQCSRFC